jgi:hypothetical protein
VNVVDWDTVQAATVQVQPPTGPALTATIASIPALAGTAGALGDAQTIAVTYQVTPPNGDWTTAPIGTYTVTLGGSPVTDLLNNAAPSGTVGTFTATTDHLVFTTEPATTITEGVYFDTTVTVENGNDQVDTTFPNSITLALGSNPGNDTALGNLTKTPVNGVVTFGALLKVADPSYTLHATANLAEIGTSDPFTVGAGPAQGFVVTGLPSSVTAGAAQNLVVTVYDGYGNVVSG